jgi:hypothetical protein
MAVETMKKPIKINEIDAKARFVTIRCSTAYKFIIQTPNKVPKTNDAMPGNPKNFTGLSSTTSRTRDIIRSIP